MVEGKLHRVGGTIYFYSDYISNEDALNFRVLANEAIGEVGAYHAKHGASPTVQVIINCVGGSISAAFDIVDAMRENKYVEFHTHCTGFCASAATIISIAGHYRTASPNAIFLFHEGSFAMGWERKQHVNDTMKRIELIHEKVIQHYLKHTNLKREKIEEKLLRDWTFGSKKALKKGFIDAITGDDQDDGDN